MEQLEPVDWIAHLNTFKLFQLRFVRIFSKSTFHQIVPHALETVRCGLLYQVAGILSFDVRCLVATEIFQWHLAYLILAIERDQPNDKN